MPKAILEFNLPEENEEFLTAQNGGKYHSVIWNLDQGLRSALKYNSDSYDEKTLEQLQKVRDRIHELLSEYDLSL
jgi:hypothetical protein